jgi:hypothetical protein
VATLERQNELAIVQIRGDIKLIAQKVDDLKNNDLTHIQKSIDNINKILWGVGFLILSQLTVGIRSLFLG